MIYPKKSNEKIFCIGRNKTGTTSLEKVLSDLGFQMGEQVEGEMLIKDYSNGNFKSLLKFCKTAQAFQDIPFSCPYTWFILATNFPNAKFILTIRDEEDWYRSLTNYHSKLFGTEGKLPTAKDLKNANYRYPGFVWDVFQAVWKTGVTKPYDKKVLLANYKRHNEDVIHYFKGKDNFIIVDVSNRNDYFKLCEFLEKRPLHDRFPHQNKT